MYHMKEKLVDVGLVYYQIPNPRIPDDRYVLNHSLAHIYLHVHNVYTQYKKAQLVRVMPVVLDKCSGSKLSMQPLTKPSFTTQL